MKALGEYRFYVLFWRQNDVTLLSIYFKHFLSFYLFCCEQFKTLYTSIVTIYESVIICIYHMTSRLGVK